MTSYEQMARLFDDWFVDNSLGYCCLLVDRIINCILGVCTMIIKKTYAENDYIIIDVTKNIH